MERHHSMLLALCIIAVFWLSSCLWAQTTATLQGTVKDESGSLMAGVQIEIKNQSTGLSRTVTSDSRGNYHASELPAGLYSEEAKMPGFQTKRQAGIELFVGGTAVVDLTMVVGAVTSVVEVTAAANIVETTSAALSNVVNTQQVEDLPLNARSFEQLAVLNPGVTVDRSAGLNTLNGRGTKITIAGARSESVSYLFDGTDVNPATDLNASSAAGFQMGVEAIQEFQVLRHTFSAEYGRSAGGIVSVLSKSGTNTFHGSLFEYLRNSSLDAKNFFDLPSPTSIPPFRRNQFGGSIGGPIFRDRTFFFLTYEGLRERLGLTMISTVPDLNMRNGFLPNPSTGQLQQIGVASVIQPYMNLYPLSNGQNFGNGTALNTSNPTQKLGENYGFSRVDHRFSDNDSFFLSWVVDDGFGLRPGNVFFADDDSSRKNFVTASETHVFSPTLLNTARFSFARNDFLTTNSALISIPSTLNFVPAAGIFGNLAVTGLTGISSNTLLPIKQVTNLFEWSDTVSLNRGPHSIKFGGVIKRYQFNEAEPFNLSGSWSFLSLQSFMQNSPTTVSVTAPNSDSVRGFRQFLNGFFLQDDWKVTPRLTLNVGLRSEFITNPSEVNGKISNFNDPRDAQLRISNVIFNQNPSRKMPMGRLGLAWDMFGNGKTAIRAGFGTFFEEILPRAFQLLNLSPPFYKTATATNPTFFPTIDFNRLVSAQPNQLTVRGIDPNMKTPYSIQYNFDVQQEITSTLRASVGYAGARGVNLLQRSNFNLRIEQILPDGRRFWPLGQPFANPNFGPIEWRTTQVNSFYNSLEVAVEKRLSHGLRLQLAYTWSRSVDDGAGETTQEAQNEPVFTPIFWDLQHTNRGLSGFDVRHALVFNYNYAFPMQAAKNLKSQIWGGWELNGITTLQTGMPMTVALGFDRAQNSLAGQRVADRPNLKAGFSNNPVTGVTAGCPGVKAGQRLGTPDLYLDPCAFELQPAGFLGNLGRNTIIGPGLANMDFSIQKRFVMPGEKKQLLFRAEFYNIFNRPNFYIPNYTNRAAAPDTSGALNIFTSANGIPVPNYGRIFITATSSRQIQFALKYTF